MTKEVRRMFEMLNNINGTPVKSGPNSKVRHTERVNIKKTSLDGSNERQVT